MKFLTHLLPHVLIAGIYLCILEIRNANNPGVQLAERLEAAVEEKMIDRVQAIARTEGHRYEDDELNWIGAVFEKWDLPQELGRRIREWENGGITYPMGVTWIHRAIMGTAKPTRRQAEGAARLWHRSLWFFVLEHPEYLAEFVKEHGTRGEPEAFVRMYRTPYTNFTLDQVWKPRINRQGMKDFIIEGLKTKKGAT